MFSTCTITHSFLNADGTPASGRVTFDLSARMTNSGVSVLPTDVVASLDAGGAISVGLLANNDPDTVPANAQWRVSLRLLGAAEETYYITVPTGAGTVDLGSLLPSAEQVD